MVELPGQVDVAGLAARLGVTSGQALAAVGNLRRRGLIVRGRESRGAGLLPSVEAVHLLGDDERRLR